MGTLCLYDEPTTGRSLVIRMPSGLTPPPETAAPSTELREELQFGHERIDRTQIYTSIRPQQLKRAVAFYEEKAVRMLTESG